jgi:hypothetical protein
LVVTRCDTEGQLTDVTKEVGYEAVPAGIVAISNSGYVTSLAEGEATIHIRDAHNLDTSIDVVVSAIVQDIPVNFPNQIVPIFTRYECNGGGCHGKSGGQNGFRLSLLGFEPADDYEYLVKEGRSRRIFPAAPDHSLLLLKATGQMPHGGGNRFAVDSPTYRLLRRWIEQGMPFGNADDPTVMRIEVIPKARRMRQRQVQQFAVVAHYTDGSTRDVTRMAQLESNDTEMAEVDVTGSVTTGHLAGSVAVMARYQGNVDIFRITIPLGIEETTKLEPSNFVDQHVFDKLQDLGMPHSELCDDATFLRRVTIDLAGRLPSVAEVESFLEDRNSDRRSRAIDRLLESTDYADYFANKWSAILRNKRNRDTDRASTYAFYEWLRAGLLADHPYDEFVREIVTASGEPATNPPVAWYREVRDPAAQVEDTAQLFLGLRIQCARCHHHPFEKWSQQDYFGFQAFFSRVARKRGEFGQDRIYHNPGVAQAKNPKTAQFVKPTGLGAEAQDLDPLDDPRHALADWMVDADNPFFAKAVVNRYWKHFFGRGLVDPEDDMRITNPASHPELLDAMAEDFIGHGFRVKHLVRTICNSNTYQLSAEPNQWNETDKQNFSRYYPRRLNAEVLLDAINQVTGTQSQFAGMPRAARAVQLPDNGFDSYFLTVFGRPDSNSACECERTSDANLAQSLHLLNSREILEKLASDQGTCARLASDEGRTCLEKIRELYLLALARQPTDEEVKTAAQYLTERENTRQAYEDLVWVLINTKEFLFNH